MVHKLPNYLKASSMVAPALAAPVLTFLVVLGTFPDRDMRNLYIYGLIVQGQFEMIAGFIFATASITLALLTMSLAGNLITQKVSAFCTQNPKTANGSVACVNDPKIGTGAATDLKNGKFTANSKIAEILNGHVCAAGSQNKVICAK
jgi:hypothetical protein